MMIPLNRTSNLLVNRAVKSSGFGLDLRCLTYVSALFQPINLSYSTPEGKTKKGEPLAKSQKLLFEAGVIGQASPGMFTYLPLGIRSLDKLKRVVDEELEKVGCQKLSLPILTDGNLWKTTGRWETTGSELLTVTDRHKRSYVLSPTHEEAITELVASLPRLTYRQLPLKLYQITRKFRDELKPRFGLLRGREFIMKDLYTFDQSIEKAQETYNLICQAYDRIFQRLRVPFVKVEGATGNIGGLSSHEYHYPCTIGEDVLMLCSVCNSGTNAEVSTCKTCTQCGSPMKETKGIEVGHTFLLGDKYSQVLNAVYTTHDGLNQVCQMGCYGIGVSRILAASIEVLSNENDIRWPKLIAPYSVCILGPKGGSKEESALPLAEFIARQIDSTEPFARDVIFDDRPALTIGKKLMEAKRVGYPYIVVVGKKSTASVPKLELHVSDCNLQVELTAAEIFQHLNEAHR